MRKKYFGIKGNGSPLEQRVSSYLIGVAPDARTLHEMRLIFKDVSYTGLAATLTNLAKLKIVSRRDRNVRNDKRLSQTTVYEYYLVEKECHMCNGTGSLNLDPSVSCGQCFGTGKLK